MVSRGIRWTVAASASVATYVACWWALQAGAHWARGDALGLASVPFTVVMTVTGWWATLDGTAKGVVRPVEGFLGARPRISERLVARPDLTVRVIQALRLGGRPVAIVGMGGSGKSTLAALACADRHVRTVFPDGIAWLEAGPRKDPVALLADLAALKGVTVATEAQGRSQLVGALKGERILIVIDNVWEARQLDILTGLSDACTILFTTRRTDIAVGADATQVPVDELTAEQAKDLLACWAGRRLPDGGQELCARVGNLALGVAITGAMVAQGRSVADVMDLLDRSPSEVGAHQDPGYHYDKLFDAIEAGIAQLAVSDQRHYAELAVFAGRGAFPREAAHALWQTELSSAETGNLLVKLTGYSLLTVAADGWYAAHDLQYDSLSRRLGPRGLAAAHASLLAGYRTPGGWADSAGDPYLARTLTGHLHDAGLADELTAVLTDVSWIQRRLENGGLADLVPDYAYASTPLTRHVLRALRMSAQVLAEDTSQVRGQLAGRLLGSPDPDIAAWAAGLTGVNDETWLSPLTPALTPLTDPLVQTLTGTLIGTVPGELGAVRSVAVTPDGTRAVSGDSQGVVRAWDLTTGRELATITGHISDVWSVSITPDGARAVSGGSDGSVRIWDLPTRHELARFTGHDGSILAVAITPDGARAVSGGSDGSVRIWDLVDPRENDLLRGHDRTVYAVAVTPDGHTVVSAGEDGSVRIWAQGRQQARLDPNSGLDRDHRRVNAVAVTPDGATVVSGDMNGSVLVWNPATGQTRTTGESHGGQVRVVTITADGKQLFSGGQEGIVRRWDLAVGLEHPALVRRIGAGDSLAVTPSGSVAVSGYYHGEVRVWDLTVGSRDESGPGSILAVAFTSDGARAFAGGTGGAVFVWDLAANGQPTLLTGHQGLVDEVAVTPDGRRGVSADSSSLRVWDLMTGTPFAWDVPFVSALAISADGTTVITGQLGGEVRVWDADTGKQQCLLTGHEGPVEALAIAGNLVVSGGHDRTVRFWDLSSKREQTSFIDDGRVVYCVAITPDGAMAASGTGFTEDGFTSKCSIRVWDPVSGHEKASFTGFGREVTSLAITPDGHLVVGSSEDGMVRVVDTVTGRELARWYGDQPIRGCAVIPGQFLGIRVWPQNARPYLLGLRRPGE